MVSRSTYLRAKQLIEQAAELMGWGVAAVYMKEGDKEPGGLLVGDRDFFESMESDDE